MHICLLALGFTQLMKNSSLTTFSRKFLTATSLAEPLPKLTSTSVSPGSFLVSWVDKPPLFFSIVHTWYANLLWHCLLLLFSLLQLRQRWARKSGTSLAWETGSTQLGWELTELRRLVTGRPLGRTERFTAPRLVLLWAWRRLWFSTEAELLKERKATGLCMSIAWKENLLINISPEAPRYSTYITYTHIHISLDILVVFRVLLLGLWPCLVLWEIIQTTNNEVIHVPLSR